MTERHLYPFLGVDPAPSEGQNSDDGALILAMASPKRLPQKGETLSRIETDWWFDIVFGRRLTFKQKATTRQYSGIIHDLDKRFDLVGIGMDPNGGGTFVKRELIAEKQLINGVETSVVPIGDMVDGPFKVTHGKWILTMAKRGDPGIEARWPGLGGDELLVDAIYCSFKEGMEHGIIRLVPRIGEWLQEQQRKEQYSRWPDEKQWALKNLDALVEQMMSFVVGTREDGTYLTTKRGAHVFSALGKKDILSAACYAYMRFLVWLQMGDWDVQAPEDADCCLGAKV